MEHLYVADTNLFFEAKRLEDLPWGELGVDPIVVALTKPVQAEIDRHKKGGGRTRKRALDMFGRVRAMLENGLTETIIREAGPRVILRTMVHVRPDPDQAEILDYDLADDRIVGIVSALSKSDGYASVSVMTDDGGVAMTASGLGLSFQLIDESWKREPVLSDKDKQIADLKKDIAAYRAQEPIIKVDNATDAEVSAHVVRRVPTALTRKNVDAIVHRLELTHPKVTDFSAPEPSVDEDGTQISYIAPNPEDVTTYTDSAYPDWIAKCRADLERLHVGREQHEKPVTVTFALRNAGTRPASKLRISFEALGDILILRRASADEDLGRSEDSPAVTRLPKPPAAPQVQRVVKRPPKPQPSRTTDIAKLARFTGSGLRVGDLGLTIPGSTLDSLTRANSVLGDLKQSGVFGELARNQSAIQEALSIHRQHENLRNQMGLNHLNAIVSPRTHGFSDILVNRPFVPPKHDPEGYYFDDWEPDIAVKSGALTCDLFRHQGAEEIFDVVVVFPDEGDVTGAILCRVQAENLTEPVEVRIPVSRKVERFDLCELVDELVDTIND